MLRRLPLRQFALVLTLVLIAAFLIGAQGTVKTKDGRTLTGEIREDDDGVTVRMRGVDLKLPHTEVESIEYNQGIDEQYTKRFAALEPKDVKGRIELARWAFGKKRLDLARKAIIEAQKLDPNNAEAAALLRVIRAQAKLKNEGNQGNNTGVEPRRIERKLLSKAQINIIRQAELTDKDTNIRARMLNGVQQRYVQATNTDARAFRRLPVAQQVKKILAHDDPEMAADVVIIGDPVSMTEFRRRLQPKLLAGCAAAGCHGGPDAGDFFLYTNANSDEAAYTNFYLLTRYAKVVEDAGGLIPGPAEIKMLDRTQPERSLLANYLLPAEVADFDHPALPNKPWGGVVRNKNEGLYRDVVKWLNSSLNTVEPDYKLDYTPPFGQGSGSTNTSTTKPAK